jgi:hypothetical protein
MSATFQSTEKNFRDRLCTFGELAVLVSFTNTK